MCAPCVWFLAAYTYFVLSFAVVCLYSVHFSFSCAKGSFLCFCHPRYSQDCPQVLVAMQRHLLWVCKNFCDRVISEEAIFLIVILFDHSAELSVTDAKSWAWASVLYYYDWGLQFWWGTNTVAVPWAHVQCKMWTRSLGSGQVIWLGCFLSKLASLGVCECVCLFHM